MIDTKENYNGLMETIYLLNVPGMKEKLAQGKEEKIEDCVPEEEVDLYLYHRNN